jgi:hypothetical protein
MSKQFVMSPIAVRQTLGAGSTQTIFNMPNQPISAIFITIEAQLTTGNISDNIASFLGQLTNIIFQWKGTSVWNMRGDDLYRMARALGTWHCRFEKTSSANNARRIMTVCVPMSRWLWNPLECFPAVDKGTTQLQINCAGDGGGYNAYKVTVEPLQLLGATPVAFCRAITFSDTPAATGNKDYDLPRLYPIVAIGVTTTNSEPSSALDDIESYKILQNSVELDFSLIQGNLARAMQWYKRPPGFDDTDFGVLSNLAGAYAQFAATGTSLLLNDLTRNFHFLNFDATGNGDYLLDASKATDLKLRMNYNTAAAMRFMPIELWPASTIVTGQ